MKDVILAFLLMFDSKLKLGNGIGIIQLFGF